MKEFWIQVMQEVPTWLATHGLSIVLIIIGGYLFNFLFKKIIIRIIWLVVTVRKQGSKESELKREETLKRIFSWATGVLVFLIVFALVMKQVGMPLGPMLAGAGILGLALGFGGQYLIRDFITGFFMIIENQYRIGDVVDLDDTHGKVEDVSLRMTTLRDMDGTVHYVPHGDIKRVSNMSKDYAHINLNLNVSYKSNLEKAIEVINITGKQLAEDPEWKTYIVKPPQFLRVEDFSDIGVVVKILGVSAPNKQWEIMGEFRKRIKMAFDREGIEIPVIHSTVKMHAPEEGKSGTF